MRVLGYADDVAMMEGEVADMTVRLTTFADAALEKADMKTKLSKTNTQLLGKRKKPEEATEEEIENKKRSYKYACKYVKAGCNQRFKTKAVFCCQNTIDHLVEILSFGDVFIQLGVSLVCV